jgi:hypothetical protein
MIVLAVIVLLVIAVIVLSYGCFNLIKQNEQLEEVAVFYQTNMDEIREKALQTEIQLKELDIKGAFEADDEVGVIFQNIKEISNDLTQSILDTYEFTR